MVYEIDGKLLSAKSVFMSLKKDTQLERNRNLWFSKQDTKILVSKYLTYRANEICALVMFHFTCFPNSNNNMGDK